MERNDWFATLLFNPTKDYDNFKDAGLNSTNTFLKSKAEYLEIPEVQERFKTPDGEFHQAAFDTYYNKAVQTYNNFIAGDTQDNFLTEFSASIFDTSRKAQKQERETPLFTVQHIPNPEQKSLGMSGLWEEGNAKWSMREVAQTQKVLNYETGEFEERKPNDFFSTLFGSPLVEARWDEDGEHEENGRKIKHYAGQWKLNKQGMPFYETLSDRDSSGKQFLSWTDVLTDDGSLLNSIDVFDSDGLEKSVVGSTMKTLASIAPLFIPYVNYVYAGAGIAVSLADTIGAFGKAINELGMDETSPKPEAWKVFNDMSAFTRRFDTSYSDEAMEGNWNYEKLVGMLSDVAAQLVQQRTIAQIPKQLAQSERRITAKFLRDNGHLTPQKLGGKSINEALKAGDIKNVQALLDPKDAIKLQAALKRQYAIGSQLGSVYMATTQAAGVYENLKEANFDEASVMAGLAASTLAFYGIMRTELGDWVMRGGLDEATATITPIVKEAAKETAEKLAVNKAATQATKFGIIKDKVNSAIGKATNLFSKEATGVFNNMAKEGAEEISEEVLEDVVTSGLKLIEEAFSSLDDTGWKTKNTYSWTETDPLERYLLAGVGGAMGGAVMKGIDKTHDFIYNRTNKTKNNLPPDTLSQLEDAILRFGTEPVVKIMEKWKNKGTLLPTTLAMDVDTEASEGGNIVYKSTEDRTKSQNDQVFDHMISFARSLGTTIDNEGLRMNEEEVVQNALLRDGRLRALSKHGIDKVIYNDFIDLSKRLVDLSIEKKDLENSQDGKNSTKLDAINKEYNDVKGQIGDIIQGNTVGKYASMMAFAMSEPIQKSFLDGSIETYTRNKLNKKYIELSEDEKKVMDAEYAKYKQDAVRWLKISHDLFSRLKERAQTNLTAFNQDTGLFSYIRDLQSRLEELNTQQQLDYTLSEEELGDLESQIINGRDLDQIIAQEKLNREENPLDQTQKEELVKGYVEEETQKRGNILLNTKLLAKKDAKMNLGINPLLNERSNDQLVGLIQTLQEVSQTHGLIDERSAEMINKIISASSRVDLSPFLANTINKLTDSLISISPDPIEMEANNINKNIAKNIFTNDNIDLLDEVTRDDGLIDRLVDTAIDYNGVLDETNASLEIANDGETFTTFDPELHDISNLEVMKGFDNRTISDISLNDEGELTVTIRNPDIPEAFRLKTTLESIQLNKLMKDAIVKDIESIEGDNTDLRNLRQLRTLKQVIDNSPEILSRLDLVEQAESINATIKKNPVYELLAQLSEEISGENLFELISAEDAAYSKLDNLGSYVISNNLKREKLLKAKEVIRMLDSIIASSVSGDPYFDITSIVNTSREKNNAQPFQTFTFEQGLAIAKQLDAVENQIDYLVRLSDANSGSKLSESKKTDIRAQSLIGVSFSDNPLMRDRLPQAVYLNEEGEEVGFFDDIQISAESAARLAENINNGSDLDADASVANTTIKELESKIYEKFNTLSETQQRSVLETLLDPKNLYDKIDLKRDSTHNSLGFRFMAQWTLSNIAYNPKDFDLFYKRVLDNTQYAPFYAQKVAIKTIFSMYKNPKLFNDFLDSISDLSTDTDKYNVIHNYAFVDGDPGSGKTTAVSWFISEMIKQSNTGDVVWASAVKSRRAENLGNVLGTKSYNIDELFDELLTDKGKAKYNQVKNIIKSRDAEKLNEATVDVGSGKLPFITGFNVNSAIFDADDFVSNKPNLIVFDEITHMSLFERDILSKANIMIVGLGDTNQEGYVTNDGLPYSADNNGFFISTPTLNMSVRSNNLNQKDNLDVLSSMAKLIDFQFTQKSNFNEPTSFRNIMNDLNKLSLKYYEGNGVLQGTKTIDAVNLSDNYLRGLINKLGEGELLAYIYDEDQKSPLKPLFDKYIQEFNDKVVMVTSDAVQGEEYKYAVIDVNWSPIAPSNFDQDFYSAYRKFYTLITRTSEGSIIIKNPNLLVENSTRLDYPAVDSSLTDTDITSYKDFVGLTYYGQVPTNPSEIEKANIEEKALDETETVAPRITIEDRNTKEKRRQQLEQLSEEFLQNNLQVVTSHNSVGIGYQAENNFEDLSGVLTDKEAGFVEGKRALFQLKSLFLRDLSDKNIIDELWTNNRSTLSILSPFINSLGINYDQFKDAIKEGSYKVKVRPFNSQYDESINSTYASTYKAPSNGDKFAKVVYQIPIDGKTLDITIGVINLNNPNLNPELLERINGIDNGYIDINDASVKFSAIRYRQGVTGEDRDRNTFNPENTSLRKYRNAHPELYFNNSMYVRPFNTKSGDQGSVTIGFVTYDLWNTNNLYDDYINRLNTGEYSPVSPAHLSNIGRDYSTFAQEWGTLLKREGKIAAAELNALAGYMTAPNLYGAVYNLVAALQDGQLRPFMTTENPEVQALLDEKRNNPDSETVTEVLKYGKSILSNIANNLYKNNSGNPTSEMIMQRFRDGDYSGDNFGLKNKKYNNLLRKVAREVNEDTVTDNAIEIALERVLTDEVLDNTDWSNEDKNTFRKQITEIKELVNKTLHGNAVFRTRELLNMYDKGVVVGIYDAFSTISEIVRLTEFSEDQKQREWYTKVMDLAVKSRTTFADGIWYNPVGIEKIKTDEGYYVSDFNADNVYVDGPIQLPHMYFNYESLRLGEVDQTSLDKEQPIDNPASATFENKINADSVWEALPKDLSLQGIPISQENYNKIQTRLNEIFLKNPNLSNKELARIINNALYGENMLPLVVEINNNLKANDILFIEEINGNLQWSTRSNESLDAELRLFIENNKPSNNSVFLHESGVIYFMNNKNNPSLKFYTVKPRGNTFEIKELPSRKAIQFRNLISSEIAEIESSTESAVVKTVPLSTKLTYEQFATKFNDLVKTIPSSNVVAKALKAALELENGKYYNNIVSLVYNRFGNKQLEIISSDLSEINTALTEASEDLTNRVTEVLNEMINNNPELGLAVVKPMPVKMQIIKKLADIKYNEINC